MNNTDKSSPSTITPDSVKERLHEERAILLDNLEQAKRALEDATLLYNDFLEGVKAGSLYRSSFGYISSQWASKRTLPSGEIVIVEQGEDSVIEAGSIADDLLTLEGAGFDIKGIFNEYRDEHDEIQSSKHEHDDIGW